MQKRRWTILVSCLAAVMMIQGTGRCTGTSIPFYSSSAKPIISDDAPHYLLWHDGNSNTWHIRWQSMEKKAKFKGELKAVGGYISLVKRVNLEKKDKTEKKDSNAIYFKGKVEEGIEGFDFTWSGTRLQADLYIKGEHRPLKVYVGRRAIRPRTVPFLLEGMASRTGSGDIPYSMAQGLPNITTDKPHYMLWRDGDSNTWHIRWQSMEKKKKFSGVLKTIGGSIELSRRVNLEKKDKTKVHAPNIITFKGKVKEQPEGFDFEWTGYKLMVDLKIDGENHPERIYVGRNALVPSGIPFYILPRNNTLPSPPRQRTIHRPPPRDLPPPFRHIPPYRR